MSLVTTVVLLLAGIVLFAGCNKDEEKNIPITEITIPANCIYKKLDCAELKLIKSQEEYTSFFSECGKENIPDIDFSKYSLFVIWGGGQCILKKNINCTKYQNSFNIQIIIKEGIGASVEHWYLSFIIKDKNKQINNSNVKLTIIKQS